jgi:3-methyladenine DNA glycosylase AlkD
MKRSSSATSASRRRSRSLPETQLNSAAALRQALRQSANPIRARFAAGYFKTGPGQYGERDRFLGVPVPAIRKLVRAFSGDRFTVAKQLLRSSWHEERHLALMLLVREYEKGSPEDRERVYHLYRSSTRYINNWDLVVVSAAKIVGAHLEGHSTTELDHLARSSLLWERRMAMIATSHFIRLGNFAPALRIATILIEDREDLIHKAVGWMLREIADRDRPRVERFLTVHAAVIPRTALRYAIEKFPPQARHTFLTRHPVRPVNQARKVGRKGLTR